MQGRAVSGALQAKQVDVVVAVAYFNVSNSQVRTRTAERAAEQIAQADLLVVLAGDF